MTKTVRNNDAAVIRAAAHLLTDGAAFDSLVQMAGEAQCVLIGEASHGTHEFYETRAQFTKRLIQEKGLATLLFDLLTPEEEAVDVRTAHLRFDIRLLAIRLGFATDWVLKEPATRNLRIGYFGASTGGGAALLAAAARIGGRNRFQRHLSAANHST